MNNFIALLIAFVFMTAGFPVAAQTAFPVVDGPTQAARDATRRQILQAELTAEKSAFEGAQQALADAVSTRIPEAKITPLRDDVHRHAANVAALDREISALGKLPATAMTNAPARLSGKAVHAAATPAGAAPFWDVYKRTQGKSADAADVREVP